jgi:hypothetical protein
MYGGGATSGPHPVGISHMQVHFSCAEALHISLFINNLNVEIGVRMTFEIPENCHEGNIYYQFHGYGNVSMHQPRYDQLDGRGGLPDSPPVDNELNIQESQATAVCLVSCRQTQHLLGMTRVNQLKFLDGDSK